MDWKDCKNYGIALINIDTFPFTLNQALILRLTMKGFSFLSISKFSAWRASFPISSSFSNQNFWWYKPMMSFDHQESLINQARRSADAALSASKDKSPISKWLSGSVVGFWPLLWLYIKKGWFFGKMFLKVCWIIHSLLLSCIYHKQKRLLK